MEKRTGPGRRTVLSLSADDAGNVKSDQITLVGTGGGLELVIDASRLADELEKAHQQHGRKRDHDRPKGV